MKYSTSVINKLWKIEDKTLEETIKLNILNFIRTTHSNEHDFIDEFYDVEFFGDIGMTFKKKSGQVIVDLENYFQGENLNKLELIFFEKWKMKNKRNNIG